MSLPDIIRANEGEQYNTYTTAQYVLGQQFVLGPDGRTFRFALNGSVALKGNELIQAKAGDDNLIDLDVDTAAAAGTFDISVTNGATSVAVDELAGGFISVYVDGGGSAGTLSNTYRIDSNAAAGNAAALVITIDPNSGGFQRAITTADNCEICWNQYSGVVVSTGATPTAQIVGVSTGAVAAAEYGWLQTKGIIGVLVDDAAAFDQGDALVPGVDAGTLNTQAAGTLDVDIVGVAVVNSAIDAFGLADMSIG